jgi:PAS domain S-box-containing protein
MSGTIEYAQLIEAIGDAIIVADLNGAITLWNPAAERMVGFTQNEAWGNRWI